MVKRCRSHHCSYCWYLNKCRFFTSHLENHSVMNSIICIMLQLCIYIKYLLNTKKRYITMQLFFLLFSLFHLNSAVLWCNIVSDHMMPIQTSVSVFVHLYSFVYYSTFTLWGKKTNSIPSFEWDGLRYFWFSENSHRIYSRVIVIVMEIPHNLNYPYTLWSYLNN